MHICPLILLLAASDDSILVSRAVNINIDNITLKPAGKDTPTHTHTQRERGACINTFILLISQVVSLTLPPTHKHSHTYICLIYTPIALTLFMPLYPLTHTQLLFTDRYSSFVYFSLPLWHIHTNTHTQTTHQVVWSPVILRQVCIF